MAEWPLARLGEIAQLFDAPHQTAPTTPDGPVVYLNVGDIRNGRIELRLSGRLTNETGAAWSKRVVPQAGDVVFGYEATLGDAALLAGDYSLALGRRVGLLRPEQRLVDPRFLAYSWYTPRFQEILRSHRVGGTTIESIRLTELPSWTIPLPPLAEQRRIADVLGALDDKIELNRRVSETLEASGRATYRSWRDAQVDRDFRLIGDACRVLSGGTPAKSLPQLWSGSIPWISPKVMTAIHCDEPDAYVTQAAIGNGTRLAPAGAILVMVRGMGLHEGVRVSQARVDVTFNQDVKALVPAEVEPAFLLFAVLDAQESLHQKVESSGHGTGVLATDVLTSFRIPVPDRTTRRPIAEQLANVNDRIGVARDQTRTLAAIRDTLLPRLLDGRLTC